MSDPGKDIPTTQPATDSSLEPAYTHAEWVEAMCSLLMGQTQPEGEGWVTFAEILQGLGLSKNQAGDQIRRAYIAGKIEKCRAGKNVYYRKKLED